jgi:hypothetical protein
MNPTERRIADVPSEYRRRLTDIPTHKAWLASLEPAAADPPAELCRLCGAECDGTKGIVYIGHVCEPCVERWRNNETVIRNLDDGTATWMASLGEPKSKQARYPVPDRVVYAADRP